MNHSLSCKVWTRRVLGAIVIVGVVAIPKGRDRNLFTEFSLVNTAKAEEHLAATFDREKLRLTAAESQPALAEEGRAESAALQAAPGKIVFRFHARDLHMVLGPAKNGKPVRFRVTLDGAAPGDDCGLDSAPDGTGELRNPRLYQLIRQKGRVKDRTFEIEFLDPGIQAFSFTFG